MNNKKLQIILKCLQFNATGNFSQQYKSNGYEHYSDDMNLNGK